MKTEQLDFDWSCLSSWQIGLQKKETVLSIDMLQSHTSSDHSTYDGWETVVALMVLFLKILS